MAKDSSSKSKQSFQYGAFFAEKVLGIPSYMLSAQARKKVFSTDLLKGLLTPKFVGNFRRTLEDLREDYGSSQAVRRRSVDEADWLLRIKGSSAKSKKRKSTKFLRDDSEDNIDEILDNLIQGSTSVRSAKDAARLKEKLKGGASNGSTVNTSKYSRPLSGAKLSIPGSTSAAFTEDSSIGYLDTLVKGQETSIDLLRTNFKTINDKLSDIHKSLEKLPTSSKGGIFPDFFSPNSKGTKTVDKLKKVAPVAALLPKVAKLAGAATVGYGAYKTVDSLKAINKAESLGLFTKEQAAEARANTYLKTGLQTSMTIGGGLAGGAVGGGFLSPALGVAGGYLGYTAGGSLGQTLANKKQFNKQAAYLATVASIESSLQSRPPATGTSNAAGLFQFMPKTWNDLSEKYNKGWQVSKGMDPSQDPRLDPAKSKVMMQLLTAENQKSLERRLGRTVTGPELYLAHFLGAEGATKLLTASPAANPSLLVPEAVAANPNIFYTPDREMRTAGQVKEFLQQKFTSHRHLLGLPDVDVTTPFFTPLPTTPEQPVQSELPSVSSDNLKAALKTDIVTTVNAKDAQTKMLTSFDNFIQTSKKEPAVRQPMIISQGSSNNQQTAMDDINNLHLMHGLYFNLFT